MLRKAHPGRADTDCETHGQYVATTCIGCHDDWRTRALAAEAARDAVRADLAVAEHEQALAEDEADRLGEIKHQDANAAMRAALGPAMWGRLWGPELERLGDVVDVAFAERDAARASATREHRHLLNLLARIHRDDGTYTEAVGVDRSVQDADTWVGQHLDCEASATVGVVVRLRGALASTSRPMAPDLITGMPRYCWCNTTSGWSCGKQPVCVARNAALADPTAQAVDAAWMGMVDALHAVLAAATIEMDAGMLAQVEDALRAAEEAQEDRTDATPPEA